MRIFLSFSVELISFPKYVNDSTDSIDSPETVCIEPCWLKLMKLVLRFQRWSICCVLYIGSSNSGTTLHGGDGRGKDLFSPFEVSKTSEIPFRAKCLNYFSRRLLLPLKLLPPSLLYTIKTLST